VGAHLTFGINKEKMNSPFTLILAILTVESSYLQEVERPSKKVSDTVQFWFTPDSQWRIKTYAIDHDIHVHRINSADASKRLTVEFAQNNIKKSYGDVTSEMLIVEFPDPKNEAEVKRILRDKKLSGTLESVKDGYYFYNPDRGEYRSQSKPK
jgi:hypothetical protein